MAYPPNQVPDAPKPLSMMPRVEVAPSGVPIEPIYFVQTILRTN